MPKATLYHRVAGQIGDFGKPVTSAFDHLNKLMERTEELTAPTAPTTMATRKLQSKRGAHNPGPGKANKPYFGYGSYGKPMGS